VTRWQMALFLTRLMPWMGLQVTPSPAYPDFTDTGHLSPVTRHAIATLADLGVTKGTSVTTFSPDDPVRRDHMALFLWRVMNLTTVAYDDVSFDPLDVFLNRKGAAIGTPFTDVLPYQGALGVPPVGDVIADLWELGIVSGLTDTIYGPAEPVTSAVMAEFMAGMLNHSVGGGAWRVANVLGREICLDGRDPGKVMAELPLSVYQKWSSDTLIHFVVTLTEWIVDENCPSNSPAFRQATPGAARLPVLLGVTDAATTTTTTTTTPSTTTTTMPLTVSTGPLAQIVIAPENCEGSSRASFEGIPSGVNWGNVGYLTHRDVTGRRDIDHVVAVHEAWCSGVRAPALGSDLDNLRASDSSVNRGKGARDPREWWDTSGKTTPRTNNYPGWCDYLNIHVKVKVKYAATMDQAEYDFVKAQLAECDGKPIPTTSTTSTTVPTTTTCPYTSSAGDPCQAVPALANNRNDVNCGDIPRRYKPLTVVGPDIDRLDGNNDGKACSP